MYMLQTKGQNEGQEFGLVTLVQTNNLSQYVEFLSKVRHYNILVLPCSSYLVQEGLGGEQQETRGLSVVKGHNHIQLWAKDIQDQKNWSQLSSKDWDKRRKKSSSLKNMGRTLGLKDGSLQMHAVFTYSLKKVVKKSFVNHQLLLAAPF